MNKGTKELQKILDSFKAMNPKEYTTLYNFTNSKFCTT